VTVNEEQVRYWNEEGGTAWVERQEHVDRMLSVFLPCLLDAVSPQPGDHILDIGAGAGATALAVAEAVGPSGRVMALDLSRPLLDRLEERAAASGVGNVITRVADAQTASLPAEHFDSLLSRFGVMFFDDPPAAFANLARAAKPAGRLAFVAWQPVTENPWFSVPLRAAMAVVPDAVLPPPGSPGPFAFGDPDRVRAALAGGFSEVRVESLRLEIDCGTIDEATDFSVHSGLVGRLTGRADAEVKAAVAAAIHESIRELAGSDGRVRVGSATWLVTARRR
jgi:SAM-dependent methyltransferase